MLMEKSLQSSTEILSLRFRFRQCLRTHFPFHLHLCTTFDAHSFFMSEPFIEFDLGAEAASPTMRTDLNFSVVQLLANGTQRVVHQLIVSNCRKVSSSSSGQLPPGTGCMARLQQSSHRLKCPCRSSPVRTLEWQGSEAWQQRWNPSECRLCTGLTQGRN